MMDMPKRLFRGARCRAGAVLAGFMALAIVAASPQGAQGGVSIICNEAAAINFTTPSPLFVGDTYTAELTLGSGDISGGGGTSMTITTVQYALDCAGGTVLPCTDEGEIIKFVGNISDTCDGTGGTTSVSFTSDAGTGDAGTGFLPNEVTFTPNVPLVLDQNSSCVLSFDVEIATFGTDGNPFVLSSAMGYLGQCDNDQQAQASESGGVAVQLCAVQFDKRLSCENDPNPTVFVDVGFDDGTADSCTSWNAFDETPAEPITILYVAENIGTADFLSCEFMESNPAIHGGSTMASVVNLAALNAGGVVELDLGALNNPVQNDCTETLDDEEPNTAEILCTCRVANDDPGITAMDMDLADFSCLTPQLGVVADAPCTLSNGDATITGEALANAGGADLLNCSAELITQIVAFGVACPDPPDGSGPNDGSPQALGAILAGGTAPISFSGTTLDGAIIENERLCAKIITTCEIDSGDGTPVPDPQGGNKVTMDMDNTFCEIPPEVDFICRTPGFWGTHSDDAKRRSQNITQAVIDAAGGTLGFICGTEVNTTGAGSPSSATEAMCVRIQGDQRRQVARQMTAAALNCTISGLGPDCDDGGDLAIMFQMCNEACALGTNTIIGECIEFFDDLNNGVLEGFEDCDRPLVNETLELDFDPPGPAGASGRNGECAEANGNGIKTPAALP